MKKGALIPRYIANKAMELEKEESYELAAVRKIPFFTALWASGGVAVLGGMLLESKLVTVFMAESWMVAIPFVFGVYASSYVVGRMLARRKVRENVFASIGVSFIVAEVVLLLGAVFGSLGFLAQTLLEGTVMMHLEAIVYAPFVLTMFGAMFCLPLSIGLGLHVRFWSKLQQDKVAREELGKDLGEMVSLPA